MKVVVVGAGIAGLTTAIALRRHGIDVTVVEQAPSFGDVGAGIQISPNGIAVLADLGLGPALADKAVRPSAYRILDLESGELLMEWPLGRRAEQLYGSPFYHLHRADLLAALADSLPMDVFMFGSACVGFTQAPEYVEVQLASGAVLRADALVGADGLSSSVRDQLHGPASPKAAGLYGWRGLARAEDLSDLDLEHCTYAWAGGGRVLVGYWMRGGSLFNFLAVSPVSQLPRESMMNLSTAENLLRAVDGAEHRVMRVAEAIAEPFVTEMYYRDPVSSWYSGRVVLIGDAAHPMVPYLAQGACQAIEDAWGIAACLADRPSSEVPQAFADFEGRRFPRTATVQAQSLRSARVQHMAGREEIRQRNAQWRGLSRIDPDGRATWEWIYGYSVRAAFDGPARQAGGQHADDRGPARPAIYSPDDISGGYAALRHAYQKSLAAAFPLPDGVTATKVDADGVAAYWIGPQAGGPGAVDAPGHVVLHLHGGGFVVGSALASGYFAARLAAAAGARALALDYRLAPEHPYPAALEDAVGGYEWLLSQGVEPGQVIVTGESSGGGLAVSLVQALRHRGEPLPLGVAVFSPVTGYAHIGVPVKPHANAFDDRDWLINFSAAYLQDADPADEFLSPLSGDFTSFPPLFVQAASGELAEGDSTSLAAAAEDAGADVTLALLDDPAVALSSLSSLPDLGLSLARFQTWAERWRHAPVA